jgi:hypothetical protein
VPRLTGETLIEMTPLTRVLGADEISELFRLTGDVGELAIAPLPSGHGVRGWLAVGRPEAGLSDERLRLLEGLSYRAAMALQKARLRRHQQQSLSMADALLDHARALARRRRRHPRAHRQAGRGFLDASEVSLWLQAATDAPLLPVAVFGDDEVHHTLLLGTSFPPEVARPFFERPEPFLLHPDQVRDIPGAADVSRGTDVAIAPFALDHGCMGFLVAGARDGETFGELQLKMLAGLADQASRFLLALAPWASLAKAAKAAAASGVRSAGGRLRRPGGDRPGALAELRHDVGAKLLEKAPLVAAGSMEDEVREAELDVHADALGHLRRVARDDEAGVRAIGRGVGEPLQLDRVVNVRLRRRSAQRRPPAAGVVRVAGVVVV